LKGNGIHKSWKGSLSLRSCAQAKLGANILQWGKKGEERDTDDLLRAVMLEKRRCYFSHLRSRKKFMLAVRGEELRKKGRGKGGHQAAQSAVGLDYLKRPLDEVSMKKEEGCERIKERYRPSQGYRAPGNLRGAGSMGLIINLEKVREDGVKSVVPVSKGRTTTVEESRCYMEWRAGGGK